MQIEEYHALERVEKEHWFYKGKRELVRWWIERANVVRSGDTIVDAGAGTGELVRELRALYTPRGIEVRGVEYSDVAREIARAAKGLELEAGSILNMPVPDGSSAVTIALDVLEHVEDDARALSELIRVTRSGGVVIINVPAFQSLWSDWDVSLGHFRRYTKPMLERLLRQHSTEIEILRFDYVNAFAFLPIYLYRKIAARLKLASRAEDAVPGPVLNGVLKALFIGPAKLAWFHPPFGVSLFCVLKKR